MSSATAPQPASAGSCSWVLICAWLLSLSAGGAVPPSRGDLENRADAKVASRGKPRLPVAAGARNASPHAHPLAPLLQYAREGYQYISEEIRDYSCLLIARERTERGLGNYEYMRVKVRHERTSGDRIVTPFSVYVKFLQPSQVKGREVLYVRGQNDDALTVRRGGPRYPNMTLTLSPTGPLAMEGRRYPLTDIGIRNLVAKLIGVLQKDVNHDECEVTIFKNAKVNDRVCTHIQVVHPARRPHFTFHRASVFIDEQLSLPIYFASYDWPTRPGGEPVLLEEYAYTQLKPNVGLRDLDFQRTNPAYGFLNPREGAPGAPPQAVRVEQAADADAVTATPAKF